MIKEKIKILSPTGLHARPAGVLVALVKQFSSDVKFKNGLKEAKGKSIISILSLGLTYGTEIEVHVEGDDEIDAMKAIKTFFSNLKN
jgi:phosphocarrier protein HPr